VISSRGWRSSRGSRKRSIRIEERKRKEGERFRKMKQLRQESKLKKMLKNNSRENLRAWKMKKLLLLNRQLQHSKQH